eukprot:3523823-Pyramimonas_sp.AAC.1
MSEGRQASQIGRAVRVGVEVDGHILLVVAVDALGALPAASAAAPPGNVGHRWRRQRCGYIRCYWHMR